MKDAEADVQRIISGEDTGDMYYKTITGLKEALSGTNPSAENQQHQQIDERALEANAAAAAEINKPSDGVLETETETESDDDDDESDCSEGSSSDGEKPTAADKKAARKENKKKVKEEKREARKHKVPKAVKKKKKKLAKAKKYR